MAIQPVKRNRVYEDIVNQLAEMISTGEFQPGDRLPPERELAKSFGVGRPTLRQALTVLHEAGVVEILPGSGVYLRKQVAEGYAASGNAMAMVLMTERKNLVHILELRVAIESEAAYLAASRRDSDDLERLKAAYRALEAAFAERGTASQEDFRFHTLIAEATHNPVFIKVMVSLADLFMQAFHQSSQALRDEPGRIALNLREHHDILTAIVEQRQEDARLAMLQHLKRVFVRLSRLDKLGESGS